jgi:cytochrome c oxidase assembly protein subunit 15
MANKVVGSWLLATSGGIFSLICLGGYTRLKRAGLSMVEWKPLTLSRPSNDAEWQVEYENYKKFPEFMSYPYLDLQDFKEIYTIEWAHRNLARGVGTFFALPMAYFWKKGYFNAGDKKRMLFILGFFGVQASAGWWMVKSGLVHKEEYNERVRVQPQKLATHLTLGMTLFGVTFWNALRFLRPTPEMHLKAAEVLTASLKMRSKAIGALHLTYVTLFAGALVAGSDAGKVHTNFPWYGDDYLIPSDAMDLRPWYKNLYENRGMIQFVHRNLAYVTLIAVTDLWLASRKNPLLACTRFGCNAVFGLTMLQGLLGINALYSACEVNDALMHQANSLLVIMSILYTLNTVRKPNPAFIASVLKK